MNFPTRLSILLLPMLAASSPHAASPYPASGEFTRSYDTKLDMLEFSRSDLGGGCTPSIEVHDKSGPSGPPYLMFRSSRCRNSYPAMATVMTATDALLKAAVRDGHNLRIMQTVMPIMRPEWVQNYIDCYVGVNGLENRRWDNPRLDTALRQCDVTPDLNAVFAKYGFKIRFNSGEKAWWFDCRNPERYTNSSGWHLDEGWLAKYRGHRCGLNVPTMWWFKVVPLRRA